MKAVILAAGEGKRLRPLTHTTPKCMLPIAGKPILLHMLLTLKELGITEAIIIVKHLKEKIISYFKDKDLGIKLTFIEQGEEYGTGAALLYAKEHIQEPFLMLAGDTILDSSIVKAVIASHKKGITLAVKKVEHPHLYGVVELDSNNRVSKLEEKPIHPKTDLANLSVYMFDPDIFSKLEQIKSSSRGEYEITDALLGAQAVVVNGFWMDIAYPWQLFDALEFILGKMDSDTKNGLIDNSTINGKVVLGKGAKIINSYIDGDVYIGENTTIGPNAYIRGTSSIGSNCAIGSGSTVKASILFDHVNAKHLSYLGDSIIGNDINFGSGTQIANYRFDAGHISVMTEKGWVNTGRKKFGCVIGDNTKFGVISCVMPGKLIGNNCWVSSGVVVNENLASNTRIFLKQEHTFMKQEEGEG